MPRILREHRAAGVDGLRRRETNKTSMAKNATVTIRFPRSQLEMMARRRTIRQILADNKNFCQATPLLAVGCVCSVPCFLLDSLRAVCVKTNGDVSHTQHVNTPSNTFLYIGPIYILVCISLCTYKHTPYTLLYVFLILDISKYIQYVVSYM